MSTEDFLREVVFGEKKKRLYRPEELPDAPMSTADFLRKLVFGEEVPPDAAPVPRAAPVPVPEALTRRRNTGDDGDADVNDDVDDDVNDDAEEGTPPPSLRKGTFLGDLVARPVSKISPEKILDDLVARPMGKISPEKILDTGPHRMGKISSEEILRNMVDRPMGKVPLGQMTNDLVDRPVGKDTGDARSLLRNLNAGASAGPEATGRAPGGESAGKSEAGTPGNRVQVAASDWPPKIRSVPRQWWETEPPKPEGEAVLHPRAPNSLDARNVKRVEAYRTGNPASVSQEVRASSPEDRMSMLLNFGVKRGQEIEAKKYPEGYMHSQDRLLALELKGTPPQTIQKARELQEQLEKGKSNGSLSEDQYIAKRKEFWEGLTLNDLPADMRQDTARILANGKKLVDERRETLYNLSKQWEGASTEEARQKVLADTAALLAPVFGGSGVPLEFEQGKNSSSVARSNPGEVDKKLIVNTGSDLFKNGSAEGFAEMVGTLAHEQNHFAQIATAHAQARPLTPEQRDSKEVFTHNPHSLVLSPFVVIPSNYVEYTVQPHETQSHMVMTLVNREMKAMLQQRNQPRRP